MNETNQFILTMTNFYTLFLLKISNVLANEKLKFQNSKKSLVFPVTFDDS